MNEMKTGLIHVYTGTGKGKTTSAVGLAVRALGGDLKVCYSSFHKNPDKYGYHEIKNLQKLGARVLIFAKGHPHLEKTIDETEIKKEVAEGIQELSKLLLSEKFDMLVMDEILISIRDGYLEEETLLQFVQNKPPHTELVLTGRGATQKIIDVADYVSEIQKIKHPYDKGINSRKGIEF